MRIRSGVFLAAAAVVLLLSPTAHADRLVFSVPVITLPPAVIVVPVIPVGPTYVHDRRHRSFYEPRSFYAPPRLQLRDCYRGCDRFPAYDRFGYDPYRGHSVHPYRHGYDYPYRSGIIQDRFILRFQFGH